MNKRFSHLVWLGAGTASEPADLLDLTEWATLVDAREAACLSLQQYAQDRVSVKQRLLTVDGANVEFTEYNLTEYSATQSVSGLKTLFPGLKAVNSERLNSTRITDFINELALQDLNNLLVVDIADSNLALLTILQQSGQLNQFSEIRIQAGIEPLYVGAATTTEITALLQQHGYLLLQTVANDPDLPWLSFSLNPLWHTLQSTQQTSDSLNKDLQIAKQQLSTTQQQIEQANAKAAEQLTVVKQQLIEKNSENEKLHQQLQTAKLAASNEQASLNQQLTAKDVELSSLTQQLDQFRSQLSALQHHMETNTEADQLQKKVAQLQAELAAKTQQASTIAQEQLESINKLQTELDLANKHATARLNKIGELEKNNRTLDETNMQLTKQQNALTQELLKVEVQIDIIRELLLKQ